LNESLITIFMLFAISAPCRWFSRPRD